MSLAEPISSVLIVGYGSIGGKHFRLLTEKEIEVGVVSQSEPDVPMVFSSIAEALEFKNWSAVFICTPTNLHLQNLAILSEIDYRGIVIVEKPIVHKTCELPKNSFRALLTAYNLRFHPLVLGLKDLIEGEQLLDMNFYVGQFLPTWRECDYRKVYSSRASQGGGVLLDLSHEIDLSQWIAGVAIEMTALGGKYSNLEIDSEDSFDILLRTEKCPKVHISLNYLDRIGQRRIIVNTCSETYVADLVSNTIQTSEGEIKFPGEPLASLDSQIEAIIDSRFGQFCAPNDAMRIVQIVERAKKCSSGLEWVTL